MIKVESQVKLVAKNRQKVVTVLGKEWPCLLVQSHWNETQFVNLIFEDTHITVNAKDLQAAITNAINSAPRYGC